MSHTRTLDIGVDMDGVVYDFIHALRFWITASTGRPAETMPNTTTWEFYTDDWGYSGEEFLRFCYDAISAGYMFRQGVPLPGTVEGINRLTAAGHRVHFVTDRASLGPRGLAEDATYEWLDKSGFHYSTLTLTSDKTSVHADVFVDDRPENYLALNGAGRDVYLMTYPYNQSMTVPKGRRISTFSEFVVSVLTQHPGKKALTPVPSANPTIARPPRRGVAPQSAMLGT